MHRSPEPNLPLPRASLPEGCSDLADAYRMRRVSEMEHRGFILRVAIVLHDLFIDQLDPEVLHMRDEELLRQRISDFLHPILLESPKLERKIGASSDLADALFKVVMANADDTKI
jgi:hypothetical protein